MKYLIITDDLHNEFKKLTSNQIKLILIKLCNGDNRFNTKTKIYHNKLERYNYDNSKLGYLMPYINVINNIKNIRLEATTKKQQAEQFQKLKRQLPIYYKIPISSVNSLLECKTKFKLLVILQIFKEIRVLRFKKQVIIPKKKFIKDIFGVQNRQMLHYNIKKLEELSCDICFTFCDICFTFCDICFTFCDICFTLVPRED